MTQNNHLPPVSAKNLEQGQREFRTALDAPLYIQFDNEAMSRGLRPYTLAKILLTSYLSGGLVYVGELPPSIQAAIQRYRDSINANPTTN